MMQALNERPFSRGKWSPLHDSTDHVPRGRYHIMCMSTPRGSYITHLIHVQPCKTFIVEVIRIGIGTQTNR